VGDRYGDYGKGELGHGALAHHEFCPSSGKKKKKKKKKKKSRLVDSFLKVWAGLFFFIFFLLFFLVWFAWRRPMAQLGRVSWGRSGARPLVESYF